MGTLLYVKPWPALFNLLFSTALEGNYYDLYFIDEKIEVQKGSDLSQRQ